MCIIEETQNSVDNLALALTLSSSSGLAVRICLCREPGAVGKSGSTFLAKKLLIYKQLNSLL